ncbi:hypothetical protein O181_131190 [Austropuccinia psidii MF-1]|uniref:Uncharacterized protein n=1 Tax=Austropuccinia psidii MF-1 TaxID=1389203 RepID=A0A9Q3L503_9BASI|nr:hypothetical protein [Austropuccinia psidii MF-1]
MLLSSIRTTNELVLKRRGELKRGCVLIVVESTQLKNASRDLRTSLGHQEASLTSREKPDHKGSSGINSSASNDFATAVNSVALVGELKTPSLPSSFHTPSIIPSQSLLPLRDEVFKEIKDVGEDVSISPLNLLQGDMVLPPLFFHASLEEQWDEEEEPEEIETALKVVPPAYHQYLDVFSKVKEEKLPPHRSCGHHIELESLLPPIGVIYSL